MRKFELNKMWILALLLAVVTAGCSDSDTHAGGAGNGFTAPTVTLVTPPNGNVGVCPNIAVISATFSKAMNPATINTSTFTLTGPSGPVAGAVTYVAATDIATFTPTVPLAPPNTMFTATITTGATDTFGNHLAANFVWMFTISPACPPPPPPPPPPSGLGMSCQFGILGATPVVSSVGPTVITNGSVGIFPAASITGFPPGTLVGMPPGMFHMADAVAMAGQADARIAFNNAAGAASGAILPADIGGLTLAPGVYRTTSAQPSLGITGDLTLSGNGIYIFQIVSTLTTAAGSPSAPMSRVILAGGALAHDVIWQIGSSATLGTNSTFAGTIIAQASITLTTGATLNGRALALTGAVTLDSNPVNVPPCP